MSSPLAGLRVVLTRPAGSRDDMADALRTAGAIVDKLPLIKIAAPDDPGALTSAVAAADSADWLVFTSANGVAAFARVRRKPLGTHMKIAAVGSATAAAVKSFLRRRVDAVPPTFVAEELAGAIAAIGSSGSRVIILQAQGARPTLARKLRDEGFSVSIVAAYRTIEAPPPDLAKRLSEADAIVLTSASGARSLVRGMAGRIADLASIAIACIGEVTAKEARGLGLAVAAVAKNATARALVDALEAHFSR